MSPPSHTRPHPRHRRRTPNHTYVTGVAPHRRRTPQVTAVARQISRHRRRTLDLTPPPESTRLPVTPPPPSHVSTAGRFQCFIEFIHFGC
nr:hypothetical protein Iba_chr08dCG9600 [Ipomoea batatas]